MRAFKSTSHEIGHGLVREGHPDKKAFPAPRHFPEPNTRQLMYIRPNLDVSSRLRVKKEWDEAEKWMKKEELAGRMQP